MCGGEMTRERAPLHRGLVGKWYISSAEALRKTDIPTMSLLAAVQGKVERVTLAN